MFIYVVVLYELATRIEFVRETFSLAGASGFELCYGTKAEFFVVTILCLAGTLSSISVMSLLWFWTAFQLKRSSNIAETENTNLKSENSSSL